jgi:glycosyltransferase involved in cell wall biosynthesis
MPTVLVEAMACCLPVVASEVGGIPEAVRDEIDGIIVPPRDPRSAAGALLRLWKRPDLRKQMGRSGRERVRSDFTLERLLDGFEDLYAAACNGRRPAAQRVDLAPAFPMRPARPNGRPVRPLRVFSAGNFGWEQGHEYTLEAVALLRSRGIPCELRLAGEGAYARPIAYARHQLGLTDAVELVGPSNPAVVEQHLGWADVFVCCAVADDGSATTRAAVARDVPVVATERAGLTAEELEGGGFSVPVRDPAAVSERLEELARRRDVRRLAPHP